MDLMEEEIVPAELKKVKSKTRRLMKPTRNTDTFLKYIKNGNEILEEEYEYLFEELYDDLDLCYEPKDGGLADYDGYLLESYGIKIYRYKNGDTCIALEYHSVPGDGFYWDDVYFVEEQRVISSEWVKKLDGADDEIKNLNTYAEGFRKRNKDARFFTAYDKGREEFVLCVSFGRKSYKLDGKNSLLKEINTGGLSWRY